MRSYRRRLLSKVRLVDAIEEKGIGNGGGLREWLKEEQWASEAQQQERNRVRRGPKLTTGHYRALLWDEESKSWQTNTQLGITVHVEVGFMPAPGVQRRPIGRRWRVPRKGKTG